MKELWKEINTPISELFSYTMHHGRLIEVWRKQLAEEVNKKIKDLEGYYIRIAEIISQNENMIRVSIPILGSYNPLVIIGDKMEIRGEERWYPIKIASVSVFGASLFLNLEIEHMRMSEEVKTLVPVAIYSMCESVWDDLGLKFIKQGDFTK